MNFKCTFLTLLPALGLYTTGTHGNPIYGMTAQDIFNKTVQFSEYRGKVLVIVNVASECGYTDGHYKGLTKMYDYFKDTGKFTILGFPCNQFGQQEPGDNDEILQFAQELYNVEFPMFSKIDVIGENRHELYTLLREATAIYPNWNFWKYLVDHNGTPLSAWGPHQPVDAMMGAVQEAVEKAIAADKPEPKHDDL